MRDNIYTLITGATKGIGYEFTKLFAKDGENLILVSRKKSDLIETKIKLERKFNIKIKIFALDLSIESNVYSLLNEIKEKGIIIDKLINNAGIGSFGYFEEIDKERDKKLIDLNINAVTILIKELLPDMKRRKTGGILNVSSTAAFVGGPKMSMYYSTKAYVLTLSEALYEECKESNVKISCLCPGPIRTGFQGDAGIEKSEKAKKYLMEPEVVAKEGYLGFKKGKAIIIPGFKNKVMVIGTKFLPRSIIRKIIFSTNK